MYKITAGRVSSLRASQNFLTSSSLISRIIGISGVGPGDHVLEIGPGKGHITRQLIKRCDRVTAVELDERLYAALAARFSGEANLRLVCADFLEWGLPRGPYKVLANIPFGRTTDIIRKLTCDRGPDDMWLIVERGAALRFSGGGKGSSLAYLLLKPFYDVEIRYTFRPDDFHPAPSVTPVLLHIEKKSTPDVPASDRIAYEKFISACISGRGGGGGGYLSKRQISRALAQEGLPGFISSGETLYIQWLCLFRCYRSGLDRSGADR